jgi:ATP-dependent protease ClpP protease subunit
MPQKFFDVQKPQEGNVAQILVYGALGWDCLSSEFVNALNECAKSYDVIEVHVNSPGGDIFEGIAMRTAIRSCKKTVDLYIDALAASMGSAICATTDRKVYMNKYGRLMIHLPTTQINGDSDTLRSNADQLDSLKNDLVDIYAKRCGKTNQEIQESWFKRGTETWFTAQEALAAGLIDGIVDGPELIVPEKIDTPTNLWKNFNTQFKNQLELNMKDPKRFVDLLARADVKLDPNATEDNIYAEVQRMVDSMVSLKSEKKQVDDKVIELQNQITSLQGDKVAVLVDSAISAKKITADQRETYMSLAKSDFENTKKVLDSMMVYTSIVGQLHHEDKSDERKDWKFEDYQKKDPQRLTAMRNAPAGSPDRLDFEKLYKSAYGSVPKQ